MLSFACREYSNFWNFDRCNSAEREKVKSVSVPQARPRAVPGTIRKVDRANPSSGSTASVSSQPISDTSSAATPEPEKPPERRRVLNMLGLRGFFTSSAKEEVAAHNTEPSADQPQKQDSQRLKLDAVLTAQTVDVKRLRELSWFGLPAHLRPKAWQLMLAYLPPNADRQPGSLEAKRAEYKACVPQYFETPEADRTSYQMAMLKQIQVDAPRTTPELPVFHTDRMQRSLVRVLYIWAIRHPASGYVQGINDLAVPFLLVFLSTVAPLSMQASEVGALEGVSEDSLLSVEADAYWCVSNMLQGIQDHYTFAQPGIQRMVFKLRELMTRLDGPLCKHLEAHNIEFMHFGFRWMNCLLVRELPMRLLLRLWDTYLSLQDGFAMLHVYICAALLSRFSAHLQTLDFQELMTLLQNLPTQDWTEKDLEMLTAQAFVWKHLFEASPSHLSNS